MPGPPPKDPADRHRRNVDAVNAVVEPVAAAPALPAVVTSRALRDDWSDLWASPIAKTITQTDLPALTRLWRLRQQFEDACELYEAEPMVDGSKKQPVLNDAGKHLLALSAQITALEDRFGLHPKGRLANGIRLGAAADAALRHPELFGDDEENDIADPRLTDP